MLVTYAIDDKSFFNKPFVRLFKEYVSDGLLESRLVEFDCAPKIIQKEDQYTVVLSGDEICVSSKDFDKNEIIAGLCIMYGYGFVKPDYSLPVFLELTESE